MPKNGLSKNGFSFPVALLVGCVTCAVFLPAVSNARVRHCPTGKVNQFDPRGESICVPKPPKGQPGPGIWRLSATTGGFMAIEVAYAQGAYKVKRTKLKFPGPTFTCTTPGESIGPTIPRTFKTAVKFKSRAWSGNKSDSQSDWGFSGKFTTAGVLTFDAHLAYKPGQFHAGCSATLHLTGKVQKGRGDDF
jgi:hypothetical protein